MRKNTHSNEEKILIAGEIYPCQNRLKQCITVQK